MWAAFWWSVIIGGAVADVAGAVFSAWLAHRTRRDVDAWHESVYEALSYLSFASDGRVDLLPPPVAPYLTAMKLSAVASAFHLIVVLVLLYTR